MFDALMSLVLVFGIIAAVRWLVWRGRHKTIKDAIDSLRSRLNEIDTHIAEIEERLARASATKERQEPALVPSIAAIAAAREVAAVESRPLQEEILEPVAAEYEPSEEEIRPGVWFQVDEARPAQEETAESIPAQFRDVPADAPAETAESIPTQFEPAAPATHIPAIRAERKPKAPGIVARLVIGLKRLLGFGGDEKIDWEALIGEHWLNILGIIILVIGTVLLAQQSVLYLGPVGRLTAGTAFSAGLLLAGILLERRPRYRIFARTLIGGGWALIFFAAYAAHNIDATRVIDDAALSLLLLVVVAAGMVVHSFKYRSEIVTGLAYALGFLAVTLTPATGFSLAASAVLAGSLIIILRLMPWHSLALAGVIGTYLNHWLWLSQTFGNLPAAAFGGSVTDPAAMRSFWLSQGVLALYWLLFIGLSLTRSAASEREERRQIAISLANTAGLIGLSVWQLWSLDADYLFYFTGPATVAYVGAAWINRWARHHRLFLINASVAVLLYAVTLPLAMTTLGIAADWIALYWTFGAVLTLAAGYLLRETVLRFEGYALSAAAAGSAFTVNLSGPLAGREHLVGLIVPLIIAFLEGKSEWLQRLAGSSDLRREETQIGPAWGYAAALLFAFLVWRTAAPYHVGLAWMLSGLACFEVGARATRPHVRTQGYLLCGLAFAAFLGINIQELPPPPNNLAIISAGMAAFYYLFWRLAYRSPNALPIELRFADVPSYAGSLLLALLLWKELDPMFVTAAWACAGLALFEVGTAGRRVQLRIQGYLLEVAAVAACLAINLYEIYQPNDAALMVRVSTVCITIAVIWFVFWRLALPSRNALPIEMTFADGLSYGACLLLASLLWKELDAVFVTAAWACAGLVLFEVGIAGRRVHLRIQSYLLQFAAVAACLAINLYEVYQPNDAALMVRFSTVCVTVAVLSFVFWRLFSKRADLVSRELGHMDLAAYAATALLIILLWKELPSVAVALAWSLVGLALLEMGAALRIRSLVRQAHVVSLLTFVRLFMANFVTAGEAFGISHRVATVVPVVLSFAYLRILLLESPAFQEEWAGIKRRIIDDPRAAARLYSYAIAIALFALLRFELGAAYAAVGWAVLAVSLLVLGQRGDNRDFRFQSYVIALLTFAHWWSTNMYLIGDFYGVPERLATTLPVVLALFAGAYLGAPRAPADRPARRKGLLGWLDLADGNARVLYSVLANAVVTVLLYYELPTHFVSIGWAVQALVALAIGLVAKERSFRLYGLVLLLACLLKITLVDLVDVATIYRIVSFMVLGAILLLASFGYTRYRTVVERYI